MNRHFLSLVVVLLALLSSPKVFSAETNAAPESTAPSATKQQTSPVFADLKDLVSRINDKIKQDKTNDTDLADDLKEFDTLVAKHKDDSLPKDRAQVLVMKARLYLEVLGQPEKALAVFKQITNSFPGVQINGNSEEVINTLAAMIERKKINDALIPGAQFPDFNEKDVEGKPLSISQFKGKVVLVDFWATWCGPCVMALPQIQKAYDKFHDQGFEIAGISLDEEKGRLQQFTKQKKMPWPQFFDGKKWENKLAVKYGVGAIPTGYLLDRNGKIIVKVENPDELESEITKALAAK